MRGSVEDYDSSCLHHPPKCLHTYPLRPTPFPSTRSPDPVPKNNSHPPRAEEFRVSRTPCTQMTKRQQSTALALGVWGKSVSSWAWNMSASRAPESCKPWQLGLLLWGPYWGKNDRLTSVPQNQTTTPRELLRRFLHGLVATFGRREVIEF